MILSDEEIKEAIGEGDNCNSRDIRLCRAIESAVLAKLKAQEPVAWRTFDGEFGYDYRSYTDNECYQVEFLARNPSSTYKNWVEPLYTHPADDVVRDLEDTEKLLVRVANQRDELLAAIENLIKVQDRHHTEIAYKRLVDKYDSVNFLDYTELEKLHKTITKMNEVLK